MNNGRCYSAAVLAMGLAVGFANAEVPVGSGFTYQGTLYDGGQLADGLFDLEFRLMTAEEGGSQSGPTITQEDVDIVGGTFTAILDFGTYIRTPDARWLAIGVRRAGGSGAFTLLSPRQELTPAPFALNLALPYSAFAGTSSPMFHITQSSTGTGLAVLSNGTGTGIQSNIQNAESSNVAVAGTTNGPGKAIFGLTSGFGTAGFFENTNAANPQPTVLGKTTGVGPGVKGLSTGANGPAGLFQIDNVQSPQDALVGMTNGGGSAVHGHCPTNQGIAGHFQIDGQTSGFDAVFAETQGPGTAVHAKSAKGRAGLFENTNNSNAQPTLTAQTTSLLGRAGVFIVNNVFAQGTALFVQNKGVGIAGHFETTSGAASTALYAKTVGTGKTLFVESNNANASAIYARATNGGTALEIDQGAIRVTGAGLNTPTAVFVHEVTPGNMTGCWTEDLCYGTLLNHPLLNNHPDAIVFVTEQAWDGTTRTGSISVYYFSATGQWEIAALGEDGDGDLDPGQKFNVMVFHP